MGDPTIGINCFDHPFPTPAQHGAGQMTDDMEVLGIKCHARLWTLHIVIPGESAGTAGEILGVVSA